ncbi:MAG: sulfite exporter TauE/SafE family protein, partial [Candidatus Altiarchaeota archaeon]|nr:sulfite exporter TauE/SafE family protein [Candidatus Altiarchaeota archaeon]
MTAVALEPSFMLLACSAFIAGVLDATVGGGGLILIPHMAFLGGSLRAAIGTSRVVFIMDSLSAVIGHLKKGNVDRNIALHYSLASVAAAPFGAYITARSPPELTARLFGVFIIAILALIAWKPRAGLEDRRSGKTLPSLAAGLLSGFMIGLLGGGVGVLLVLLMVFASGATFLLASGTSQ